MAYHCDLWHEAALFLKNQKEQLKIIDKLEDEVITEITETAAASLYERAISTYMRTSCLTHLAYADFEEVNNNESEICQN